jgi:hypothetical protein
MDPASKPQEFRRVLEPSFNDMAGDPYQLPGTCAFLQRLKNAGDHKPTLFWVEYITVLTYEQYCC